MTRSRKAPALGLPPIQPEEPRQLRLTIPGRLGADLDLYRQAYKAAYGGDVESEALILHIVETFIRGDRSFKTWRAAQNGGGETDEHHGQP